MSSVAGRPTANTLSFIFIGMETIVIFDLINKQFWRSAIMKQFLNYLVSIIKCIFDMLL